jgi:hypothetical protein
MQKCFKKYCPYLFLSLFSFRSCLSVYVSVFRCHSSLPFLGGEVGGREGQLAQKLFQVSNLMGFTEYTFLGLGYQVFVLFWYMQIMYRTRNNKYNYRYNTYFLIHTLLYEHLHPFSKKEKLFSDLAGFRR